MGLSSYNQEHKSSGIGQKYFGLSLKFQGLLGIKTVRSYNLSTSCMESPKCNVSPTQSCFILQRESKLSNVIFAAVIKGFFLLLFNLLHFTIALFLNKETRLQMCCPASQQMSPG